MLVLATLMASPVLAVIAQCRNASIQQQYPFFSMLPVYLGRALVQNESTHLFTTEGNCFTSISIATQFSVVPALVNGNISDTVTAELTITLASPLSTLCMEHFVVGTPF